MPAIWTPPATWTVNQLVTAGDLNEQVRDNLEWLKSPPMGFKKLDEGADYTTTSTNFVIVDTTFGTTLNVVGGNVLVGFSGTIEVNGTNTVYVDVVRVGSGRVGGDDGIFGFRRVSTGSVYPCAFTYLVTGVPAGNQTFRLMWRVSGGTATLYSGAGTSNWDVHPMFWAREV